MQNANVTYVVAGLVGAVAVVAITILIYATFFQSFLSRFDELSSDVEKLIEREQTILAAFVLANLAHGFLIATVVRWGKFYTPLRGAVAGATVAFLTEIYFLFTQYALFKTMTLATAILDTLMWSFINAIVGALVALVYRRWARRTGQLAAPPEPRGEPAGVPASFGPQTTFDVQVTDSPGRELGRNGAAAREAAETFTGTGPDQRIRDENLG